MAENEKKLRKWLNVTRKKQNTIMKARLGLALAAYFVWMVYDDATCTWIESGLVRFERCVSRKHEIARFIRLFFLKWACGERERETNLRVNNKILGQHYKIFSIQCVFGVVGCCEISTDCLAAKSGRWLRVIWFEYEILLHLNSRSDLVGLVTMFFFFQEVRSVCYIKKETQKNPMSF